ARAAPGCRRLDRRQPRRGRRRGLDGVRAARRAGRLRRQGGGRQPAPGAAEVVESVTIAGLVLSLALAAVVLPAWTADMLRTGLVRENWRGRTVAFPLGALLVSVSVV